LRAPRARRWSKPAKPMRTPATTSVPARAIGSDRFGPVMGSVRMFGAGAGARCCTGVLVWAGCVGGAAGVVAGGAGVAVVGGGVVGARVGVGLLTGVGLWVGVGVVVVGGQVGVGGGVVGGGRGGGGGGALVGVHDGAGVVGSGAGVVAVGVGVQCG
jgi:hypothetical protein